MKLQPAAVPADLAHHSAAVGVSVLADGGADIAQKAPGLHLSQADLQALLRNLDHVGLLLVDLADAKHARRVGKISV